MYTVDIDTGGTMTDGLVWDGTTMVTVKVDTTPHDLTVSFRELLGEAARQLGFGSDLGAFLDEVSLIRWSSTITSNTLGERKGAKLGLLVQPGSERSLYGDGPSPAVGTLVAERNVVWRRRRRRRGRACSTRSESCSRTAPRRICVSLDMASLRRSRSRRSSEIVESRSTATTTWAPCPSCWPATWPRSTTGRPGRTARSSTPTCTSQQLATSLFKAEDMLRYDEGWTGALLVGHTNGGVGTWVGKTKGRGHRSSPGHAFGTHAAAWYARQYGLDRVVCLDVGGTPAKSSGVEDGQPRYPRDGNVFGIPVSTLWPCDGRRFRSPCGGSIVRPDGVGGVRLGPESMGAALRACQLRARRGRGDADRRVSSCSATWTLLVSSTAAADDADQARAARPWRRIGPGRRGIPGRRRGLQDRRSPRSGRSPSAGWAFDPWRGLCRRSGRGGPVPPTAAAAGCSPPGRGAPQRSPARAGPGLGLALSKRPVRWFPTAVHATSAAAQRGRRTGPRSPGRRRGAGCRHYGGGRATLRIWPSEGIRSWTRPRRRIESDVHCDGQAVVHGAGR